MKEIKLTQNQIALIDDEDYEKISKHKWYARYSNFTKSFYALRNGKISDGINNCKSIMMAREIMNTLVDELCDHIDHNTLNNQKYNLRNCTKNGNMQNKKIKEGITSKFKGVSLRVGKYKTIDGTRKIFYRYRSQLHHNSIKIYLGEFKSEINAALRYDEEAFKLFKKFSLLNFPNNIDLYKFLYK
jgi:hypothetical protein